MNDPQPKPPAPAPVLSPASAAAFAWRAVRRRWPVVALPLLLGVGGTAMVASAVSRQTWEATGTMLYAPPPVPEAQKGLYAAPDLSTLAPLVKSPGVLAGLIEEFDLSVPPTLLDKLFKVTVPRNTQSVTVSLQWGDPDTAAGLTNRLMERFNDLVREYRRTRVGGHLADAEARLREADSRRARAAEAVEQFLRLHNLSDLTAETDAIRAEIQATMAGRAAAMRDEAACLAQQERMTQELEAIRRKDEEAAASAKKFDAALETLADNRRRQERLRELIAEERQRQEWMAQLAARRKDYDRVAGLRAAGAVTQLELDSVTRDIEVLTTKLRDNEKVTKWRAELDKLDQVVVPDKKTSTNASPIIQQALFRRLEMDLTMAGAQRNLAAADKTLATLRGRLAEVQARAGQVEGLRARIEAEDADRQKLADQISLFARLRDSTAPDFAIVTPARPGPFPVSSNKKLWLLGGGGVAVGLGLAAALALEARASYHGGRLAAAVAGIPSLGELAAGDVVAERLTAARLRDWRPGYGAVLLLAGGPGTDPLPCAARLARRLAARDERVLIIDCRLGVDRTAPAPPGLAGFLRFEADAIDALGPPMECYGVDLIPAGAGGDLDLLATHRMRDLLQDARGRYSLVLLVGHALDRADAMDTLGRFADGVVGVLGPTTPARSGASSLSAARRVSPDRLRVVVATVIEA